MRSGFFCWSATSIGLEKQLLLGGTVSQKCSDEGVSGDKVIVIFNPLFGFFLAFEVLLRASEVYKALL